jgi:2-methylcitrate dehydratase PrpD
MHGSPRLGPQGFLSAVSPEWKADREGAVRPLGTEWQIVRQGISIKKYPACYCTHRALDGMLELLASRPLKPAEIARITVAISKTHSLILRNHEPQTGLEAKFSMEFAMARHRAGAAEAKLCDLNRHEPEDRNRARRSHRHPGARPRSRAPVLSLLGSICRTGPKATTSQLFATKAAWSSI